MAGVIPVRMVWLKWKAVAAFGEWWSGMVQKTRKKRNPFLTINHSPPHRDPWWSTGIETGNFQSYMNVWLKHLTWQVLLHGQSCTDLSVAAKRIWLKAKITSNQEATWCCKFQNNTDSSLRKGQPRREMFAYSELKSEQLFLLLDRDDDRDGWSDVLIKNTPSNLERSLRRWTLV